MNSEPNLKWSDINSIPKILNDYINFRKKIKNTEDLFIRNDYIFSREDFLTNDYFLCEIILLLTALSKKAEIGEKEGLFLLIDGKTAISGNTSLGDIYEKYADEKDGFLYIIYTSKEVWGGL